MPPKLVVSNNDIANVAGAKGRGYEGQACDECGNFTLVRTGASLKCDTCGTQVGEVEVKEKPVLWPTVRISRSVLLAQVKREWPDRHKVAMYLADTMDSLSCQCPPMARSTLFRSLAGFGATVAQAKTPEQCIEACVQLTKHLACPEPGWEGASLIIEE